MSNSDQLRRLFPFRSWFVNYSNRDLKVDFLSGLTIALVLVPQSMAYAQLAGLPAYFGLYAAFLPPIIAALFGSSRFLATGPVAVVSLMTATALEPLATAGSEAFIAYAIVLALMVGLFQFLLGIFRLGLVVNFLSHPVVFGFTTAAALIIATSQLSSIFGIPVEKAEYHYKTIYYVLTAIRENAHWPTVVLATIAFGIMIILKKFKPMVPNVLVAVVVGTLISWFFGFEHNRQTQLFQIQSMHVAEKVENFNIVIDMIDAKLSKRVRLENKIHDARDKHGSNSVEVISLNTEIALNNVDLERLKEMAAEYRGELRSLRFSGFRGPKDDLMFIESGHLPSTVEEEGSNWRLRVGSRPIDIDCITLVGGGVVVGNIPVGLPQLMVPELNLNIFLRLLPIAIIIALLGFMEAISIAKTMAAKSGQLIDPNQELIGQGLANIAGSFTQSGPVAGSFSRSAINFQSGAASGMSNVFSGLAVVIVLLFLTPLFYHLPQAVLAAIIIMAVAGLVNFKGFTYIWKAKKNDGYICIITFCSTLFFAPHLDWGIIIGVVLSVILQILRGMKPVVAMLSLHPDGNFRDQSRFGLEQCRHIALVRFQGSLFFANVEYLEKKLLALIANMPELKHILIVGSRINKLDSSGEELLDMLVGKLHAEGFDLSISGLNDDVLDEMKRTGLYHQIGEDHFYPHVSNAVDEIWAHAHMESDEKSCPLKMIPFRRLPTTDKIDHNDPRFLNGPKDNSANDED